MGEIKSVPVGDPFGWLSNPAAFHEVSGNGLGLLHAEWIVNTRYDNITTYHRFNDKIAIGAGFTFMYRPDIQGYDEFGLETTELKSNNYQALVGVGYSPVNQLTLGINVKYYREKLDEWTAGGAGVDLGAVYEFKSSDISLGFVAQNLGQNIKFEDVEESIPTTMRFGISHTARVSNDYALTLAADLAKPKYETIFLCAGEELELFESIAVRAGYNGQEDRAGSGFTMGEGVKVTKSLAIDYAWTPYGDLGYLHRISLFFRIL